MARQVPTRQVPSFVVSLTSSLWLLATEGVPSLLILFLHPQHRFSKPWSGVARKEAWLGGETATAASSCELSRRSRSLVHTPLIARVGARYMFSTAAPCTWHRGSLEVATLIRRLLS